MAQEYPPDGFEIIVVDDGSTDRTPAVVESISNRANTPQVRLLRQPARGLNSARNAGVREARGQLICFVDDDVDAPPGWLQAMIAGAMRHPEAACLGGPIRLRLEGPAPRLCGREPLGETELDLGPSDKADVLVWGANMAVRRSAFDLVGLFSENLPIYGDEQEWEERLLDRGGRTVYVPDAWLWHRRTADDLRLLHMLKRRFVRGANSVPYRLARGEPTPRVGGELYGAMRVLGHAVRRGCTWGLLASAAHLGTAWGAIIARSR